MIPFRQKSPYLLIAVGLLGGCATLPEGPGVLALPGTGKSFDQFRNDDAACRAYAYEQVGGKTASRRAGESGARSAAVGAVAGGLLGAGIDGRHGAAVGAGTGLVVGGLAGSHAGETSAARMQERYDIRYVQCMYANGHRVPVAGVFTAQSDRPPPPPPPPRRSNAPPNAAPPAPGNPSPSTAPPP